MSRGTLLPIAVISLLGLLLAACSPAAEPEPTGEPVAEGSASGEPTAEVPADDAAPVDEAQPAEIVGSNSLVKALRAEGATVQQAGDFRQPFFKVSGRLLDVNEGQVQVFEFDSVDEAADVATTISEDGTTIGTSTMMWVDTPHFYQTGKLIVLYIGNDASLTALLETVLGPQIAGG